MTAPIASKLLIAFALAALPATAAAQAVDDAITTGSKLEIDGCDEIAYYKPGRLRQFEGVYYSWIDNDGFVPCKSLADCKRFMELDSLGIQATEKGWIGIHDGHRRYNRNWGTYRIRFLGRRGKMNLPRHCLDHTLPDVPAYVRVEKVLSMERFED